MLYNSSMTGLLIILFGFCVLKFLLIWVSMDVKEEGKEHYWLSCMVALSPVLVYHLFLLSNIHYNELICKRTIVCNSVQCQTYNITYNVPAIRAVWWCVCPSLNSLAKPKSDILGFMFSSSKILLALISLCMILCCESWWRKKPPRHTNYDVVSLCPIKQCALALIYEESTMYTLIKYMYGYNMMEKIFTS